jgi:hypothetical protein
MAVSLAYYQRFCGVVKKTRLYSSNQRVQPTTPWQQQFHKSPMPQISLMESNSQRVPTPRITVIDQVIDTVPMGANLQKNIKIIESRPNKALK